MATTQPGYRPLVQTRRQPDVLVLVRFLWRVGKTLVLGALLVLLIVVLAELAGFPKTLTDTETALLQGISDTLDAHTCPSARCEIALTECWQTLALPNALYVLTGTLYCSNASTPAFTVGADNVEIDGRGHTLVSGPNTAVFTNAHSNVRIHHLVFEPLAQETAANTGTLAIVNSSHVRVHDVRFNRHAGPLLVLRSNEVTLERVQARGAMGAATGIPGGISIYGSTHVTLRDSSFHDADTSQNSVGFWLGTVSGIRNRDVRFENVDFVGYASSAFVAATDDSSFVDVHTQRGIGTVPFANVQVGSSGVNSNVTNVRFTRFTQTQSPLSALTSFGLWLVRGSNVLVEDSQFTTDVSGTSDRPVVAVGHPANTFASDAIVLRNLVVHLAPLYNQSAVRNSGISIRSVFGGSVTIDNCDVARAFTPLSILDANGTITVRNSRFSQGREAGVAASSGASGALRLVLDTNVVDNNCATGVWLGASVVDAVLKDNIIAHNGVGASLGMTDLGVNTLVHASNVRHGNTKACAAATFFMTTGEPEPSDEAVNDAWVLHDDDATTTDV